MARTRARKNRAAPQCTYKEGARRCIRNGTGNPTLCQAHRLVFAEQVEREARQSMRVHGPFHDAIDEYRRTGRLSLDPLFDVAVAGIAGMFMGAAAARGAGGTPGVRFTPFTPFQPFTPFTPFPPFGQGGRMPPPLDHDALERQKKVIAARAELGFEPRAPLAVADVERRRKELARKYHPDLGGDADRAVRTERMVRVNAAADLLVAEGNLG